LTPHKKLLRLFRPWGQYIRTVRDGKLKEEW
jgi:hypothetical protein